MPTPESIETLALPNQTGRRPSFRIVLLLVILPQIAAAVALTGWLAYRGGRQSVEDMTTILRGQYTQRIQDNLADFFGLAPVLTELNQELIRVGQADVSDIDALSKLFWKQLQAFDTLGWVAFGRADGGYLSLQRITPGVIEIDVMVGSDINTHELLPDGSLGRLLRTTEDYDPRVRDWYVDAVEAGRLTWTDVYQWIGRDILCLDAVVPVTDADGQLVGVLDAGFSLEGISVFLGGLRIGRSGVTFIMERSGALIGSSAGPVLTAQADGSVARVDAVDSQHALVRAAAQAVAEREQGAGELDDETGFRLEHGDGDVFVEAAPVDPAIGLDWLIVVAVPAGDFMGPLEKNARRTIVACVVALLIAALLSLVMVRWIARPLMDLASRAKRIQTGDLDVAFVPKSRDEIGVLTQTMGEMVAGLKEREFIRNAFGRYVPPGVVHDVMSSPEALALGGRLQPVTVLMSDLRGFSVLTAQIGPADMVRLLNHYLGLMTAVIVGHGGMVNDFIGDAILALFGAPVNAPDDAERAMRCALAMQVELQRFNRDSGEFGELDLEMGIGLDTGEVIVGNIGSEQRVKYGVVGDAVNMAARIESLTVGGQVLVSRETYGLAPDPFDVGPPMTVRVKGRAEALTVYELMGACDDPELRVRSAADLPMQEVDLTADLFLLSGKSVVDEATPVTVTRLGDRGLEMLTQRERLEPLQNVKLRIRDPGFRPAGWYAKVHSVTDDANGQPAQRCLLTFTSVAERTLEDKLRQRISASMSEGLALEDLPVAQREFLGQLARAPIASESDRTVTTRILVEMACADGVVKDAERKFVNQFLDGDELESFEELLSLAPLTRDELAAVTEGPGRETMLMLAWATALCDAELADAEVYRLSQLATGLGVSEQRALELQGSAQLYLADAAFSIVWPEAAEAGAEDETDVPGEALSDAYGELIEGWAPRYGQLLQATLENVPQQLQPAQILELGCGHGHLAKRLIERYGRAEIHLVEASPSRIARVRRRFADRVAQFHESSLTGLSFESSSFDLVVSSLALHRLADAEKRALFRQIHDWLRPGGCFSYADIFLGATEEIRARHLAEWRQTAFALGTTEDEWNAFVEKAESLQTASDLAEQLNWLSEAGFAVVDCTWRSAMWTHVIALNDA